MDGRVSNFTPVDSSWDPDLFGDGSARAGDGPAHGLGALLGRGDLDDGTVLHALGERLEIEAGNFAEATSIAERAKAGDARALAYLRGLLLPAPKARLAMPIQSLQRTRKAPLALFGYHLTRS